MQIDRKIFLQGDRLKDKNTVVNNLMYSIVANLLSMFVSAILLLVLPNLLGETEYGYWQLYLFYTSYVGFFHLGLVDGIYLRIGGKYFDDLDGHIYATQFLILTIFEIIISVVIINIARFFVPDVNKVHVIFLTCICMVIYIANNFTTYVLQATNRIKPYATVVMLEKAFFAIMVIGCWFLGVKRFEIIACGDIAGKIVAMLLALKYCKNIIFCKLANFKSAVSEMWINLSIGSKLVLANVASMLITGIVRLAIENYWSIEVFGKISLAMSISSMLMVFVNAVSVVVFPMLKRMENDKLSDTYEKIRDFLMFVLLGAFVFYYPLKIILTGILPGYAESIRYMALMFPVCIFDSKISLLVNTYLKALRKEKAILIINVLSVAISVGMTGITVYLVHSLELAVVSIVVLLAFKCDIAEIYLSRCMEIAVVKDIIIESGLVAIFIVASWFLDNWYSMGIYFVAFVVYCFIKRDRIKKLLNSVTKK